MGRSWVRPFAPLVLIYYQLIWKLHFLYHVCHKWHKCLWQVSRLSQVTGKRETRSICSTALQWRLSSAVKSSPAVERINIISSPLIFFSKLLDHRSVGTIRLLLRWPTEGWMSDRVWKFNEIEGVCVGISCGLSHQNFLFIINKLSRRYFSKLSTFAATFTSLVALQRLLMWSPLSLISGRHCQSWMTFLVQDVAKEISRRLVSLFEADSATGRRACHGDNDHYAKDEFWKELVLFYEYFDADSGRGCGARYLSHSWPLYQGPVESNAGFGGNTRSRHWKGSHRSNAVVNHRW